MNFAKQPPITIVVTAFFWLAPLSAAGREEAAGELAPPPPTTAAAPTQAPDHLLESEFELLQEPVVESVSKREESVFTSPLSADVITREQIEKSGARSIPEALRLFPGMIVREQSSGNFDVHIRGLDNLPPGSRLHYFISTTVLVMIDYRVVYNYLQGGTYWEALPIDIVDVERIELVRGPVAALYGPNAVTGVINIITRKLTSDGLHVSAHAETAGQQGWKNNFSLGQRSLSGRAGYKYNSVSGGVSANYLSFDRLEGGLYSYYLQRRVAEPRELVNSFLTNTPLSIDPREAAVNYPELNLGRRSVGINAFASYEPNERLSFVLTGGYQESRTLREYIDSFFSPMSTHDGQSWYVDLRSRFHHFTFQASFMGGRQVVWQHTTLADRTNRDNTACTPNVLDLNLDYDFVWEWLRVRPGVSFRRAQYSGTPFITWEYSEPTQRWMNVGGTKALQNISASVGLEQTPWKNLRFVEAVRLDVYFDRKEHNYYPSTSESLKQTSPRTKQGQRLYPSFQFAVTYTPADDHFLRVSYARASKSPSMIDSFYSLPSSLTLVTGNNAVDLLTLDTVELGYRARFNKQIDLSVEVFGNYARDFGNSFFHGNDSYGRIIIQYDTIDLKAWQLGITISSGFTAHRLQARVFATVQQTRLEDLDLNTYRTYDVSYVALDPRNRKYFTNTWYRGTPDVCGGLYLNYQPIDKLNLNLNAYYFSRHTQIHGKLPAGGILTLDYSKDPNEVDIQQSFLLNAKISYNFWDGLTAFINLRNLFNINQEQFAWGDANHILCLIGLQYEF